MVVGGEVMILGAATETQFWLETDRAPFDFAQGEDTFLMAPPIYPHPERSRRTHGRIAALNPTKTRDKESPSESASRRRPRRSRRRSASVAANAATSRRAGSRD